MEFDDLGAKFWWKAFGICVAVGVAGMLLFMLLGAAWYAWGAFGTILLFGAGLLIFAWLWDKREARTYKDEALYH